jgi:hypothetical protein
MKTARIQDPGSEIQVKDQHKFSSSSTRIPGIRQNEVWATPFFILTFFPLQG